MEIIPAIDIKGGKCVRLYQGDYNQETVFSEDPVDIALNWQAQGARRLHLVDLDGAASGEPRNIAIVEAIVKRTGLPVQLGGGIRDEATVARLLAIGINRVILGTVAVEKPDVVRSLCQKFSQAIVVGIDARDDLVATRGWLKDTGVTALELAQSMVDLGVKRIIYTDIRRDGTLTEPNYAGVVKMVGSVKAKIIVAGGISEVEHLRGLGELGVEGAIVGMALYTGRIDLKAALALEV
jgi:phosphoribosylformimino-5-aminoimidazole carboxamide ribotide isomerase